MSLVIILAKIFFWGFGGVLLVLCGTMCGFWPVIFNFQLKQELILTNTSRSFDLWKDTPIPMYLEIYMFNWTNPVETLNNSVKPNFIEMGPYVFSENHKKMNLVWNNNGTVTFNQRRRWIFIPEMSKGFLSDKVTNLNVIAMTIGNMITKYVPKYLFPVVNEIVKTEEKNLYVTKTVQELLFDGYFDKLLNITKRLEKYIKIKIPFDKFGWFYNRNNSIDYDGVFNMDTGANGIDDLGNIIRWNYKPNSPSYPGPCGKVEGTSGELWPINAAASNQVKIFATDICSSITLIKDSVNKVENIRGTLFTAHKSVFDNGEENPNNKCYCTAKTCAPTGARDISSCRFGAPAFISLPHFYLADEAYTKNVSGMFPSPKQHNFHLILEKTTSIPLEVRARLQINIYTQPIKGIKFYENLPTAYIPMLWFDEHATVTPAIASELSSIVALSSYVEPALISLTVVGGLLVIIGLILWRFHFFTSTNEEPLIASTSSSTSSTT